MWNHINMPKAWMCQITELNSLVSRKTTELSFLTFLKRMNKIWLRRFLNLTTCFPPSRPLVSHPLKITIFKISLHYLKVKTEAWASLVHIDCLFVFCLPDSKWIFLPRGRWWVGLFVQQVNRHDWNFSIAIVNRLLARFGEHKVFSVTH